MKRKLELEYDKQYIGIKNHNNIELSYLVYLDADSLYGWEMFQKYPVNGFKWKKNVSKLHEKLIKWFDEDSNKEHIFEVDIEYPKDLQNLHSDYHSYQKE